MKINVETTENSLLLVPLDSEHAETRVENQWFSPEYWQTRERLIGKSYGRNTTWFIRPEKNQVGRQVESCDWVLRHYYRGGMVAKISRDQFFYTGIERTRPYQELLLLMKMKRLGLPVPNGVAARVVRRGFSYSADLLMEKLSADDLVKHLANGQLSQSQWRNIGEVIGQFHSQGVFHADLNAHNIMIDQQQKVWLIDFDRCGFKKPQSSWQQQNIQRLQRSLLKETTINSVLAFDSQCWQWLTAGYRQQLT